MTQQQVLHGIKTDGAQPEGVLHGVKNVIEAVPGDYDSLLQPRPKRAQ